MKREEIFPMDINEFNMYHFLVLSNKNNEIRYWSEYFVKLVKAIFGQKDED